MTSDKLTAIQEAASSAALVTSIEEALDAILDSLSTPFELLGGALAAFTPDDTARILAIRMAAPTSFVAGQEIALGLTPATLKAAGELVRERAIVITVGDGAHGILEMAWQREGIGSLVAIPLSSHDSVDGILVLNSYTTTGITERDAPLFASLGKDIESRLVTLIHEHDHAGTTEAD